MVFLYTINGLSGTPREDIVSLVAEFFKEKEKKVATTADPQGTQYGQLANEIIVTHRVEVSSFTEALLYISCSKEMFDHIDLSKDQIVVSRGSFLETLGYQNQLADWELEDARAFFTLFAKQIQRTFPILSIILTENYETAEKRAGDHFEYKGKKEKYLHDSNRFLRIKHHPIIQEIGLKIVNVEVNNRAPTEVFQKEIKPLLEKE